MNKNFLIVGCGRSGTTLLKTILDQSDELCVLPETFFYTKSIKYNRKVREKDVDTILQFIESRWWIRDMNLDFTSIRHKINGCDNFHELSDRIFLTMLNEYGLQYGSGEKYVGEKTTGHILEVPRLLGLESGLKVIAVLRDPRGVYCSYKHSKVGTSQIAPVLEEWQNAFSIIKQYSNHKDFLCVKYEDLVENSSKVLNDICSFLEIEYRDDLLEFHTREHKGYSPEQIHHKNTQKPLFKGSIKSWTHKLREREIAVIEAFLAKEIDEAGYCLSGVKATMLELDIYLSRYLDFVHKNIFRRPKQFLKLCKAKKRMSFKSKVRD